MTASTSIHIRFGRPAERATLEDLQRQASLVWEDYRAQLMAQPELIHLPMTQIEQRQVRVAEIEGEAAGFSVVLPVSAGVFELDGLFVRPTHWRRGIGWALLGDAVDVARQHEAHALDVVANPRAEALYAKFGFVQTGLAQTQLGPAHRMRYVVTDSRPDR